MWQGAVNTSITSNGGRSVCEEKYDRALSLSKHIPEWRLHLLVDLKSRGVGRDGVLALAQHLIDQGYFVAGGRMPRRMAALV